MASTLPRRSLSDEPPGGRCGSFDNCCRWLGSANSHSPCAWNVKLTGATKPSAQGSADQPNPWGSVYSRQAKVEGRCENTPARSAP